MDSPGVHPDDDASTSTTGGAWPKLIYSAIASIDGFVEDANGEFSWAAPDEEVHQVVNDLERPVGTYLYGRRMYDTMCFWETAHSYPDLRPVSRDLAATRQAADKVVFSRTLAEPSTAWSRVERDFDADLVRRLKPARERHLSIGGWNWPARRSARGWSTNCN